MSIFFKIFLVFISIVFGLLPSIRQEARAQILDDSTQQVYGPQTTQYFTERDIFEETGKKHYVDTTLEGFHQYTEKAEANHRFVNMGSFGTALRPVYYEAPRQIGTRLGISPYQPFAFTPENVRYFDTKSPFTHAYYVQGNTGDQMIHFMFSRSVNERWGLGFHYVRLNSNFLFGGDNNEIVSDHIRLAAHTSFQSKNRRYHLLYHYAHLNQPIEETGGVLLNPQLPENGIFAFREADANLGNSAESWQSQNNQHLYHQYRLDTAFTLYHILDIKRQRDIYTDRALGQNVDFYPPAQEPVQIANGTEPIFLPVFNFNDEETTGEGTTFRFYQNQFGIKGKLGKGFNYSAYFKNRIYNWDSDYEGDTLIVLNPDSTINEEASIQGVSFRLNGIENFIGGQLFYQFNDSARLAVEAELSVGRDYRIEGIFYNKNLQAGIRSVLYSPTLLQRRYVSNHFLWDKSYSNTLVNEGFGGIELKFNNLRLNPYGSYKVINNYIYFDTLAEPQQADEVIQIFQAGLNLDYSLWVFRTRNQLVYTTNLGADLIRVPDLLINSRVYCQDCFLKKYLESQIGIEMHFKSAYFTDAYMPVTKQFHLQDFIQRESYAVIDVFLNFKIKRFRGFLKFSHLNQLPEDGYITTAIYPGQPRAFTFGISWMFFN